MLLNKNGLPDKDYLTRELLNNSYSDIDIFIEYRYPSTFISYVKTKTRWYWGAGYLLEDSVIEMIHLLEYGYPKNKLRVQIPNPIDDKEIDRVSGLVMEHDPLREKMIHKDRKIHKIVLSSKNNKLIVAKTISSNSGVPYQATGENVVHALCDLFANIKAKAVNIKANLPTPH